VQATVGLPPGAAWTTALSYSCLGELCGATGGGAKKGRSPALKLRRRNQKHSRDSGDDTNIG